MKKETPVKILKFLEGGSIDLKEEIILILYRLLEKQQLEITKVAVEFPMTVKALIE